MRRSVTVQNGTGEGGGEDAFFQDTIRLMMSSDPDAWFRNEINETKVEGNNAMEERKTENR